MKIYILFLIFKNWHSHEIIMIKFKKINEEYKNNHENIIENNSEADLNIFSILYRNNNRNYYNNIDQIQSSNNKKRNIIQNVLKKIS